MNGRIVGVDSPVYRPKKFSIDDKLRDVVFEDSGSGNIWQKILANISNVCGRGG
jgi:hypothetical protein